MLPKHNRLTKDKEFDSVFKKGRSSYTDILGMKSAPNSLDNVRLGILISNKISKKAAERNKIKRRIREAFRANLDKIKSGNDFVAIALPAITKATYQEIEAAVATGIKKTNTSIK